MLICVKVELIFKTEHSDKMDAEQDEVKSGLLKAVSITLDKQYLVKVSKEQFNQLQCIVERMMSLELELSKYLWY